jgi:nitroreductase
MINAVLKTLEERRSIRDFSSRKVEGEKLAAILKAGTYAATGMGKQSPIIVVVDSPEMRERIRSMNARIIGRPDSDPFYGAPTILLVLANADVSTCVEDGSLVLGNLMNAAYALGVDSCWIHRAREEFASDDGKALLRAWGIEGNYIGVGHLAVGYRNCEYPTPRPRKKDYIYIV